MGPAYNTTTHNESEKFNQPTKLIDDEQHLFSKRAKRQTQRKEKENLK
jgi:hypothetical protein